MTKEERRLEKARSVALKKYGRNYVNLGGDDYHLDVERTGSLMLDFKLGIGGAPYGHAVEVFGANRLGKSSALGYPLLGNVQKSGKVPALIAIEPRMVTPADKEWGLRLGFDSDKCLVQYPDNAEQAFDMLRDLVFGNLVDYIMVDSLGGMGREAGTKEGGRKQAYGISGEVTSGLNDIMPTLYKNNIGLLVINQQRQGSSLRPGLTLYDSPGGEALHHHMRIRIHLKPGTEKFTAHIGEEVPTMVGRELICHIIKNNMSEGQEKKASFNFFHIATGEHGFGIDVTQDVINTGMVSGVVQKDGGTYFHESFPNGKLFGKPKVKAFLSEDPEAYEQIRQGVMKVMLVNELEAARKNREAKKVEVQKVETEEGTVSDD